MYCFYKYLRFSVKCLLPFLIIMNKKIIWKSLCNLKIKFCIFRILNIYCATQVNGMLLVLLIYDTLGFFIFFQKIILIWVKVIKIIISQYIFVMKLIQLMYHIFLYVEFVTICL